MDYSYYSFILGPLVLISLYALCFFIVIVVKATILFFKNAVLPQKLDVPEKSATKKRKPKTIKTIEIDSNTVDRIYFKKSS